jgi:hypothetical protein
MRGLRAIAPKRAEMCSCISSGAAHELGIIVLTSLS